MYFVNFGIWERTLAAARELAELQDVARKAPRSLLEALLRTLEAGEQPLRGAFIARSLNALSRLSEEMDEGALGEAVSSPSDYEALLRALETPDALDALRERDPLLPARLRGLRNRERLLSVEGPALTAEEAASALGITRQGVDKRRRAGRLLALTVGRRGYLYPAWQFVPSGVLPGLEEALAALGDSDSWMQLAFMVNANTALGGQVPLSELRRGNLTAVLRAARTYGEQVAV
jgi:hypothetical protein